MHKKFFFQMEVKDASQSTNSDGKKVVTIEGFASTPDVDRYKDIVEPSAFKGALEMYMKNPVVLRSHNPDQPIGMVTSAVITEKGLKIKADIMDESTQEEIMDGRMRALSIGYIPLATELQHEDGTPFNFETDSIWDSSLIRVVKSLDLVEISVVSTPANGNALFTVAKSLKSYFSTVAAKAFGMKIEAGEEKELKPKPTGAAVQTEAKAAETAKAEEKPAEQAPEAKPAEEAKPEAAKAATVNDGEPDEEAEKEEPAGEATPETPKEEATEAGKPAEEAEKAGATPAADGAEVPAEKPAEGEAAKAEAKPEGEGSEAKPAEEKVFITDKKTIELVDVLLQRAGKTAPKMVEKSGDDTKGIELPEAFTLALHTLAAFAEEQAKKVEAAEAKRTLKVHSQFGEETPANGSTDKPAEQKAGSHPTGWFQHLIKNAK